MRISYHGLWGFAGCILITIIAYFRNWDISWVYFGGAISLYSLAIIILITRIEYFDQSSHIKTYLDRLNQSRIEVGAALYEASKILGNERFNKIHNLTNQHIGLVIDTTKELKSYDEDEIKKFELIRLTIGCHLAFAFLITGLILELDVLPANFIYFFSAILAGMAIPYLLFRQKIK